VWQLVVLALRALLHWRWRVDRLPKAKHAICVLASTSRRSGMLDAQLVTLHSTAPFRRLRQNVAGTTRARTRTARAKYVRAASGGHASPVSSHRRCHSVLHVRYRWQSAPKYRAAGKSTTRNQLLKLINAKHVLSGQQMFSLLCRLRDTESPIIKSCVDIKLIHCCF
jgi:hypothetical protein